MEGLKETKVYAVISRMGEKWVLLWISYSKVIAMVDETY